MEANNLWSQFLLNTITEQFCRQTYTSAIVCRKKRRKGEKVKNMEKNALIQIK